MESSCFLQCRLSFLALPSPTSSCSSLVFLSSPLRNGGARRKSSVHINSFCSAKFLSNDNCEGRMNMVLGIPLIPISRFMASAIEGGRDASMTDGSCQEKKFQSQTPANVFLSLLKELGLLWLAFIGALFGFPLKEKKAMEAEFESLKKQLSEREDAIISTEKSFKMKLHNEQEESRRHLREAKEVQESLARQLELAKDSLEYSKDELEKEKKLAEDLKHQVANLSDNLTKAARAKKEHEGLMNEKLEAVRSLQENIDDLNLQMNDRAKNIQILSSSLSANDLELKNARILCSELESNMSKMRSEFAESLQRKLNESEQNTGKLAMELASTKEHLEKTKDEVGFRSSELAATVQDCEALRAQLQDVCKKLENAERNWEEERERVASLNKENQGLEIQRLKDKDARRSLENTLDEATKSLDEMNHKALHLSRDLEKATTRVYVLEEERSVLCKTVEDQKKAAQEAHENLDDARGMMMRLGEEKESWERKAKKLEEDLQLAKGEILRLRSKARNGRSRLNNRLTQNTEAEGNAAIHARKNGGI